MAYQLAFDIYESATQQLIGSIVQSLSSSAPIPSLAKGKLLEPSSVLEGLICNPIKNLQIPEKDLASLVIYFLIRIIINHMFKIEFYIQKYVVL